MAFLVCRVKPVASLTTEFSAHPGLIQAPKQVAQALGFCPAALLGQGSQFIVSSITECLQF